MPASNLFDPTWTANKWHERSNRIQNKHYDAAASLMRWHYWTGGPLVVLSVIEGSTLLVTLTEWTPLSLYAKFITGIVGLLVAVLAAMQAFMSFESRSNMHYDAGVKYGAIKRKLETRALAHPSGTIPAGELEQLGAQWNALTEESPPIPHSVWHGKKKKGIFNRGRKAKEQTAQEPAQDK
jgi:hypothetical protein